MRIAILSRNALLYSTSSLIKAAQKRGHNVCVIDHVDCDIIIENNKNKVYYYNQEITNIDAIIPRIGSSATDKGLMIIRQFESQGVFTILPSQSLVNARDKINSLQLLSSVNIPVPKTMVVNNIETMRQLISNHFSYPIIIKLAASTHGNGVLLIDNHHTATSLLEHFHENKQKVLVQDFIKESKGSDIRVFVVDNKIVGVMQRQAMEGEFRSNLHRGGYSFITELTRYEEEIAIKATQILNIPVAGVDLLRSDNGPMIIEVNASPGLEGIETTTQKDIATQIILYIERNALLYR